MKICSTCNAALPLDAFYARRSSCKECTKAAVRANYRRNRDRFVAYDKRRERTAERKAAKSAAARRYRERNPEKRAARVMVSNAIRDGRLLRQPCRLCGSTTVHAHHHDYSKPLDVEWLCKDCHWRQHGAVTAEAT